MKKMRKRILSMCLCSVMLVSALTMNASAAVLPDGGSLINCGDSVAEGKTSGGSDGWANMRCVVNAYQEDFHRVTATMYSDVREVELASVAARIEYYFEDEVLNEYDSQSFYNSIPDAGLSVSTFAPNQNGIEGTGGYAADFATRGSWNCGTWVEF